MKKFFEIIKKVLFVAVQISWGLPQTLTGAVVFLFTEGKAGTYRCAVHKKWKKDEGLSLGLFMFTSPRASKRIKDHEYGHCLQSLILGPLYLPVIGLPSLIWCSSRKADGYRKRKKKDYFSFYTERTADTLGKAKKETKQSEMEEVYDTYNS